MTAPLGKTRSVLRRDEDLDIDEDGYVGIGFHNAEEGEDGELLEVGHADYHPATWIMIAEEKWKDLGSPTEITVTIGPGNTLEDEAKNLAELDEMWKR